MNTVVEIMMKPRNTREDVLETRKRLSTHVDLVFENCKSCTKLPKSVSIDRQNPICNACPYQKELWDCGMAFNYTLTELKHYRKREGLM